MTSNKTPGEITANFSDPLITFNVQPTPFTLGTMQDISTESVNLNVGSSFDLLKLQQSTVGEIKTGPIDILASQVDLNSPYNNALRIDHNDEPTITSDTVANLTPPAPFYHGLVPLSDKNARNMPGELMVDKSGQLMLKYLTERGVINDLITSYNKFILERIPLIIASRTIEVEKQQKRIRFVFSQPKFELPFVPGDKPGDAPVELLPRQARQEQRTYSATLRIDIEQQTTMNNMVIKNRMSNVKVCEIPVMLGSVIDHLRKKNYTGDELLKVGECKYDPFGYYIIRGDEKIILTQNKLRANRILIYPDNDGDNVAIYTSQTILGHMPVQMYYDNDGTIRFHYNLMSSKKRGGKVNVGKGNKNKEKNTVNILQIFRLLGKNAPEYARDPNGDIITDEQGFAIQEGRFDDLQNIITYIISFIDPKWQKKALLALQASYAKAVSAADDFLTIYEKSTLVDKYERSKTKASRSGKNKPMDPSFGKEWHNTRREINDRTVEFIFTHITLRHITPDYIESRAISILKSSPEIQKGTDLRPFLTAKFLRQIEVAERFAVVNRKIMLLAVMTARFIEVIIGKREIDDRDAVGNQRFVTGGQMMEQLFSQMWNDNVKYMQKEMERLANPNLSTMKTRMNKVSTDITGGFINSFNPNQWGAPGSFRAKQENVTDRLDRGEAQVAIYSHLLRINAPTNRRMKSPTVRSVKQSQLGFIDPVETPSGGAVGLVNNRAVTCWISVDRPTDDIWKIMENDVFSNKRNNLGYVNIVMLNGEPKGWCNAVGLRNTLVNSRRDLKIPFDTSIVIDEGILNIYTDGGRPTKPVLIIDDNLPLIAIRKMWTASFDELLKNGIVEYQDQWELKVHGRLAASLQQLTFLREDLIRNRNLLTQLTTVLSNKMSDVITYQAPNNVKSEEIRTTINKIVNGGLDSSNSRETSIVKWLSNINTFNNMFQRIGRTKLVIKRLSIKRYSHVDMDPTSILGISGSVNPLMDRNPGPRNAFQCGMSKQAMGLNYSNPSHRYPSTARYLSYPSRPLLATQMQKLLGLDDMPSGNNVIVAIMTMDNNEEDAVVIKKEAIERGLFTYTIYHSSTLTLKKEYAPPTRNRGVIVRISDHLTKPLKPLPGHKISNYDSIDQRGLAIPDTVVNPGDCLIGAMRVIRTNRKIDDGSETSTKYQDTSLYVKVGEGGIVDKVLVARNGEGSLTITVRVRKTGQPIVGDKVATRQAQKSTIGKIVPESELPFTEDGLIPDIILNPHAIPKRMTMATLIEIMTSKYAALAGERVNGTIFRPFEIDSFMELMQTLYGYNMYGNEQMISPTTGEIFPSQIMIGPAYYQLLKHQVAKKVQVRGSEGPRSIITGQAAKGKKVGGGVRFGENELSGTLAHGASHFIQERMYTSSDPYAGTFCKKCNKISVIDIIDEQSRCSTCHGTDIGSCNIPRTYAAMTSYVSTLGIRTDIFQSENGQMPRHIRERRLPPSPTLSRRQPQSSTFSASSSITDFQTFNKSNIDQYSKDTSVRGGGLFDAPNEGSLFNEPNEGSLYDEENVNTPDEIKTVNDDDREYDPYLDGFGDGDESNDLSDESKGLFDEPDYYTDDNISGYDEDY